MIARNICPICGSENPEGSLVCQVCKADLQALPDDLYPSEPAPAETVPDPEISPEAENEGELDPDSPVPVWLQKRFQQKDKRDPSDFDFDSFSDVLFGSAETAKPSSGTKTGKGRKPRKQAAVYQPPLGNMNEAPLIETDEDPGTVEAKNFPNLEDFKTIRPVKKWDDPVQTAKAEDAKRQADKAFEVSPVQMPLWWQQDAPLVETDPAEETEKAADTDDDAYFSSVSPTKVLDPEKDMDSAALNDAGGQQEVPAVPAASDEYKPDSGSLVSALMNEIDSNSVTPAPRENKARNSGTVFYTGSREEPAEEPPAPAVEEVSPEDGISSAAALDQILRNMGYQTEEETSVPGAEPAAVIADESAAPAADGNGDTAAQNVEDPAVSVYPETKIPEKDDLIDELDIPWDLFGSQDMSLPQSPADPAYRTFSRSGLPADQDSSTYQQRMMSSILEKIIYAENFVPAAKKRNDRAVSYMSRLFWFLAAVGGIVLILMTGLTDRITLPAVSDTAETEAFMEAAGAAEGDALVVLDYSPAYSAELDRPAERLLTALEGSADEVRLLALNPAAMPNARRILQEHDGKVTFSGWRPAGLISIRSALASERHPESIWLITADSGSVRNWAEQITASNASSDLYVLSSGQLEPLLKPYLEAGMIRGMMSRDTDMLRDGDDAEKSGRKQMAVLYLAMLIPLAWLGGIITKFLQSDPDYGRKSVRKEETVRTDPKKEAADDGRL